MLNNLKKITAFLSVLLLIGMYLPNAHTNAETNELSVKNAGFEDPVIDQVVPGWGKYSAGYADNFQVTKEKSFSGENSLMVESIAGKQTGITSEMIEIEPDETYTASLKGFIDHGSIDLYVRLYDEKGVHIGNVDWKKLERPTEVWTDHFVTFKTTANAKYMSICLFGSHTKSYKYYVDAVKLVKGDFEVPGEIIEKPVDEVAMDLGVQITKTTVMLGDIGKDPEGRDVLYTVVAGAPAKFAIVDVETEKTVKSFPLEGTSGAWGVKVSSDGTVYLGAYNNGYLYKYTPKTDTLVNLGYPVAKTDPVLYPMDIDSKGNIYGGTYGSGSVYKYDADKNEFTNYGRMVQGQDWIRSTVFDEENQKVYAGVGSKAHLIEYDIKSGAKKDILPEQFADITSVYDMNLVDGKLFAQKESSYEMFVIDTKTGQLIEAKNGDTGEIGVNIPESSRGISPKSPVENKVYFTHFGILHEYDLDTNTFKTLNVDIKGSAISYKFIQLEEEGFPGYSLVGLSGNGGKLYKYNLETGNLKLVDLTLPAEPVLIHELMKGPDGKIYSTGYLPGNMGIYSPTENTNRTLDGIGQGEGMTSLNGKIYLGVYPNAKIYEYDPAKPWERADSENLNPDLLFSLEQNADIAGYTPQDRPFAMLGVEKFNKLFIGTVPKNGLLGGAFAIYEPGANKDPEVHWNMIQDQSIVSLAYKNGKVFGGTTVAGGQGSTPTATEAKFFVWDVEKGEKTLEIVPVAGKKAITALVIGADGNVWGMANGTLFSFNPETEKVTFTKNISQANNNWRDARLEIGTDGNIYGLTANKFFKYDVANDEVTHLASKVEHMAQDDFGAFYLSNGNRLYKYTDETLSVDMIGAEINVKNTKMTVGDKAPINLKALLEKNRSTSELAGAEISYIIKKPNMVSIENGIITAKKSGATTVQAIVTLNGKTVKSNTIKIQVNNKGGNKK